jgi:alkanesulfonate monooxygenase SsuD/methylene tetrahydromethanopterin reductase-like flavin-dependent oxidoreductase (luciferase family)
MTSFCSAQDGVPECVWVCAGGLKGLQEREFLLVGSPETIVRQLRRYDGVGVTEFNIAFYHRDVKTALAQIQLFAEEVIPGFRPKGAV